MSMLAISMQYLACACGDTKLQSCNMLWHDLIWHGIFFSTSVQFDWVSVRHHTLSIVVSSVFCNAITDAYSMCVCDKISHVHDSNNSHFGGLHNKQCQYLHDNMIGTWKATKHLGLCRLRWISCGQRSTVLQMMWITSSRLCLNRQVSLVCHACIACAWVWALYLWVSPVMRAFVSLGYSVVVHTQSSTKQSFDALTWDCHLFLQTSLLQLAVRCVTGQINAGKNLDC